jgi:hypothetical protein
LESALTIREQVLGDEHIKTAICLAKLGEVLYALEDLAGAQQHLERALAIRQKVLGEEHELTTKVQNLLVAVLKDKKSDEAG